LGGFHRSAEAPRHPKASLAPENLPEFPAFAVMAVPGLRDQVETNADEDPMGREEKS
jgi:hypothetical protein